MLINPASKRRTTTNMINISTSGLGHAVANRASASTRKKIIKTSIELFNKYGIQNVTTKKIAATAGISPSNLTYHFKRKNDLMMAILVVLEEHMREALTPPRIEEQSRYSGENMAKVLSTLWDFRFFFNALSLLLSKDKKICEEYFRFQGWVLDTLDQGFQELIRRGDFHPINAPNSTRLLAGNVWNQWLGWLHMQQIRGPYPKGEALYECALHFWSLIEPYFANRDANYLLPVYRSIFLKEAPQSRPGKTKKIPPA